MTRASTSATLVTLQRHDRTTWLIKGPADINEVMGRFQAARLVAGLGYLIADEHLPKFEWFAAHTGLQISETHPATAGPVKANPLPECVNCGTPARREHEPQHCPGCGHRWRGVVVLGPSGTRGYAPEQSCECGHIQTGKWGHCAKCGKSHKQSKPAIRQQERGHAEPTRLSETLPATLDRLGDRP